MESHIYCSNPQVIINPQLKSIIRNVNGELHILSSTYNNSSVQQRLTNLQKYEKYIAPFLRKLRKALNYDIELLNQKSYYLTEDGEIYPCYTLVRCGHCSLCGSLYVAEWSNRILAEYLAQWRPTYMATLTYNDSNLPSDGVVKKDVQDFLKRFRINLVRNLNYTERISYYCVSEYSPENHRPHYHIIFFNLPVRPYLEHRQRLNDSWQKGYVLLKKCDGNVGRYLGKYLGKYREQKIDGKNPNFRLLSKKFSYVTFMNVKDYFVRYPLAKYVELPNPCITKYCKSKTLKVYKCRYMLNSFFPTYRSSLPKHRRDLDDVTVLLNSPYSPLYNRNYHLKKWSCKLGKPLTLGKVLANIRSSKIHQIISSSNFENKTFDIGVEEVRLLKKHTRILESCSPDLEFEINNYINP